MKKKSNEKAREIDKKKDEKSNKAGDYSGYLTPKEKTYDRLDKADPNYKEKKKKKKKK